MMLPFPRRAFLTSLANALLVSMAAMLSASTPALAQDVAAKTGEGPLNVVQRFTAAQQTFDQTALREMTSEDYIEVSPIGDVDTREQMLGFYAPAKREQGPTLTITEPVVRTLRDTAIVIAKISFGAPGANGPGAVSMRATFVARRLAGRWKLSSLQYTPIRAKSPAQ